MRTRVVAIALALAGAVGVCASTVARAADRLNDDRPNEDQMFGGPPAPPATPAANPDGGAPAGEGDAAVAPVPPAAGPAGLQPQQSTPTETGGQPPSRDEAVLGDPNAGPKLSSETAPEDPLKIGGQIYFRSAAQFSRQTAAADTPFSAPTLVDAYFDARPNERVRGFVLGRMAFDPTLPSSLSIVSDGSTSGGAIVPLLSGAQNTRGPSVVLDQLWLRFDIERTVFITAGRQHVKWGTARFWTPTDFLHPVRRNPIAVFDARPGFTMLKLHVPWEQRGWNFYGFGLVEGANAVGPNGPVPGTDSASMLGSIGGALRAEAVFGPSEWGVGGVFYRGQKPRFGGDVSFGVGDFDFYVDAGFRFGSELSRRGYREGVSTDMTTFAQWLAAAYPVEPPSTGLKPQVTAGTTYSLRYNDNDVFTVTGEYFYNSRGYNDVRVYPGLFVSGLLEPFYTGRHYAALAMIAAAPWSWNYTTFTLSTLGNLSDKSFLTRLDYSLTVLTHLRFEAFAAVNYGRVGEFHLRVDEIIVPPIVVGGESRSFRIPEQSFSLGLGLRIAI